MASFRLTMATQLGEKVAADHGFKAFPIKPLEIAKQKGIVVEAKPPETRGVSGAMIFAGGQVRIIYSRHLNNPGFEHFCVAHELGHYFMPGHPEEIRRAGGTHVSRSNFTESSSIELEADHFAGGLLLPARLTKDFLYEHQIGLEGVLALAGAAECSATAAAIRAGQCCGYPVAVIVSQSEQVAYAFLSDGFKQLGRLAWLKKGSPLPASLTRRFNADPANVENAVKMCGETHLGDWFGGQKGIALDEEVLGLGSYGFTLTILSSEARQSAPDEEEDEEKLENSWTPKFAYGR